MRIGRTTASGMVLFVAACASNGAPAGVLTVAPAPSSAPVGVGRPVPAPGPSGVPPLPPAPSGAGAPHPRRTSGVAWAPEPGVRWQWQLTGALDTSVDADVFDIDLFNTAATDIADLHGRDRRVVCYFSAGSVEEFRPDASAFPPGTVGKAMVGWAGEKWLDVRSPGVRAVHAKRLDLAWSKGCDGVEPDNVDGYSNDTGFSLTAADQLSFNRFLAEEAHARGLAVALKNDVDQVGDLMDDFDFALNEECFTYGECDRLRPFVAAQKAVLQVDYGDATTARTVCARANAFGFDALVKDKKLDAFRIPCR